MFSEALSLLPDISAVLAIGKPRGEKSLFAHQFMEEGIRRKESVIYVVSNTFPENVVQRFVHDASEIRNFRIIDCYTLHSGINKTDESMVLRVSGPYALNEISILLTRLLRSMRKPFRIVFDSLSTFLLHNKLSVMQEFLELNIMKLKSSDATILFLVEDGMHDAKELALLETLTDVTLRFNSEEKVIKYKKIGEEISIKYRLKEDKITIEAV